MTQTGGMNFYLLKLTLNERQAELLALKVISILLKAWAAEEIHISRYCDAWLSLCGYTESVYICCDHTVIMIILSAGACIH